MYFMKSRSCVFTKNLVNDFKIKLNHRRCHIYIVILRYIALKYYLRKHIVNSTTFESFSRNL